MNTPTTRTAQENTPKKLNYSMDSNFAETSFGRFAAMREKEMFTDTFITSRDGKRFPVHSLVMATSSDYFYEKLTKTGNDSLSEYVVVDDPYQVEMDSKTAEQIISFCYSGNIELAADTLDNILAGAKELKITSLMRPCSELLEEILNESNCLQMFEMAEEYQLNGLQEKAMSMINFNLPMICKSFEFYHMDIVTVRRLFQNLSRIRDGVFDDLIKSLDPAESEFIAWIPELFIDGHSQAIVRSAFIAGYIRGLYNENALAVNVPAIERETNTMNIMSICEIEERDDEMNESEYSEHEPSKNEDSVGGTIDPDEIIENVIDSETDEETISEPADSIMVHLKQDWMRFSSFCDIEFKWEQLPTGVIAPCDTETFNETILIPTKQSIAIFHIGNSVISRVHLVNLMNFTIEDVPLPKRIENLGSARFCQLNDEIYCFGRQEKFLFHKLNVTTKTWSMGHIANSMDSWCIVGFKKELYFIGCGYTRSAVHSYHVNNDKWTARGYLHFVGNVDTAKAIASNGSIYVVHSSYDSTKVFDRTEFLVQRYEAESNEWAVVHTIKYAHYVSHFHLDTAGPFLFLYYGEGEVQRYTCQTDEWNKLPAFDFSLLETPICMIEYTVEELRTNIFSALDMVGEVHL